MREKVYNRVGVFDSGVGGLTVLKSLTENFPDADYIYLGDTARVPYGIRSRETIKRFAAECCRFLEMQGAEIVIVACNSASATSLEHLKKVLSVPVIGVIEPGVEFIKFYGDGMRRVGIIGTRATVNSESYQKLLKLYLPDAQIYAKPCPLFVPLVEEGMINHPITRETVKFYLEELKGKLDGLILGCTHYPLLKREIQNYLGPDVILVESGPALVHYLKEKNVKFAGRGQREFFVTDDSHRFTELSRLFLGLKVKGVRLLDVTFLESLSKTV